MKEPSLGKSKEDYLEAILIQTQKNGACRSTDVAKRLGFSRPSVSVALKNLEDEGFLVRDEWRILLTEKGRAIAEQTFEKHAFFRKLFVLFGIPAGRAEEEACLVEHVISEDSFQKIEAFVREKKLLDME